MRFDVVAAALGAALRGPLPGSEAQGRMAVRPRRFWQPGRFPEECRHAAGLLLVYPVEGEAAIPLTRRSARLSSHQGQVSLPGGALEPGEDAPGAALREAAEEIGLDAAGVEVAGALTPLHIPVSGYVLHPVIATALARPRLVPSEVEVERLFEARVGDLADPARLHVERWEREGHGYEVPLFRVDGETVWGATAMILAELLAILGRPPDPWGEGR